MSTIAAEAARVAYDPRWAPLRGWHDDHRAYDRTADYLPAVQQVRAEFDALVEVCAARGLVGGRCLQLGLGACRAPHEVWRRLFSHVVTIDWKECLVDDAAFAGCDAASIPAWELAARNGSYDLVFLDADHTADGVQRDHEMYGPLARSGGVVAFHDAARRPGYEDEVTAWRYLETVPDVTLIGTEVGTAWVARA